MTNEKSKENLVSTPVYTIAAFGEDPAKSKLFKMQLFERSILMSVHSRREDGKFELKAMKTSVVSQNDIADMIMMFKLAKKDFVAGKEFEYVIESKKSAFGLFGIKKDDELIAGFAVYDANEGMVIQNSKIVTPIYNKRRVRVIEATGELVDKIAPRAVQEFDTIIGLLTAIQNGESNIMSIHLEKLAKKNNPNGGYTREANVELDDSTSDSGDEFPF